MSRRTTLTQYLITCAIFLSFSVGAQVMRCTDARSGKVTYTDGACSSGTDAYEVESRKTPEELRLEREQAAVAIERKRAALRADLDAAKQENQNTTSGHNLPNIKPNYAHSRECARSRRNLDIIASEASNGSYEQNVRLDTAQRQVNFDCLGPADFAEIEKARAANSTQATPPLVIHNRRPTPVPPVVRTGKIVNCNVFRCYDNQGNVIPR